jgi:glycosyltransferase involved in cell wall biosynthesis
MQQGEVRNAFKLEVVLYGYEPSFSEDQRSCSEPSRIKKIGTISRLTDQKDIPTMLESFRKYLQIEPSATLAILGEGSLEVTLKDLTESLNLGDSVKFLGRSSRIYDFLHGLDAFILTSKYEGFGLVLLEAMDVGIPIVASRNSAIPEVLGSEFPSLCETGNSTDFSNKLNLLNDFKYREGIKVIQEGRLALFSSTVMSQKISQIYSS